MVLETSVSARWGRYQVLIAFARRVTGTMRYFTTEDSAIRAFQATAVAAAPNKPVTTQTHANLGLVKTIARTTISNFAHGMYRLTHQQGASMSARVMHAVLVTMRRHADSAQNVTGVHNQPPQHLTR